MGMHERTRIASIIGASLLIAACVEDEDWPGTAAWQGATGTSATSSVERTTTSSASAKNTPPRIYGRPLSQVLYDSEYVFEPNADDPDGDILHFEARNVPSWASFEPSTGRLEGKPGPGDVGTYEDIQISVSDGADDAELAAFAISVGTSADGKIELSWEAPTENEDGTPLTDLAGYRIYYGTIPGEYTHAITIENPGVLTYVIENLVPATYYFAATAFNAEGEESEFSEETASTIS
jgi:hypothetical protein